MDLQSAVVDAVITIVSGNTELVDTCADLRVSCEGWLNRMLLHYFHQHESIRVEPELAHVDLTLFGPEEKLLVELKTFPTNYGRGGKPITNFISSVIGDLRKLGDRPDPGVVVWMAYPVPQPDPEPWVKHVDRVRAASIRTLLDKRIELGKHWCAVYAMVPGPESD